MKSNEFSTTFSAQEQQLVLVRLHQLLGRQVARYLSGDSTSLPTETAEEILRSLLYTLRLALAQTGRSEREFLNGDLDALLYQGQQLLQEKLPKVKRLWQTACLSTPPLHQVYLEDTLRGMADFFQHYDPRYFAHQISCAIDYPLCSSVSEELQGVCYLEQWLGQLLLENWFLNKFSPQVTDSLLARDIPDYGDYPLNLCEPVLLNAVALTLLQKGLAQLVLSDVDLAALGALLRQADHLKETLHQGLAKLLARLNAPEKAHAYFVLCLDSALPRLRVALDFGELCGIFVAS